MFQLFLICAYFFLGSEKFSVDYSDHPKHIFFSPEKEMFLYFRPTSKYSLLF